MVKLSDYESFILAVFPKGVPATTNQISRRSGFSRKETNMILGSLVRKGILKATINGYERVLIENPLQKGSKYKEPKELFPGIRVKISKHYGGGTGVIIEQTVDPEIYLLRLSKTKELAYMHRSDLVAPKQRTDIIMNPMIKSEMYYCTVCHRRHRKGSKIYLKHRKYMWHYR